MHVITNNPRVSVSHDELRAKFRLHIAGATLEDAGPYMCQINSMPVVKQVSISVFLPLYSFTWNSSNAFSFVYTTCWSSIYQVRIRFNSLYFGQLNMYQILSLSASCELYLWVLFQTIKFWKLSRSLELSLLIKIFRKSVCRSRRQVISSIISFFRPVIWQSFNRQTSQKSQETWVSTKEAWQGSPAKLQVTRPPLFTGRESKEMKKLQFGRLDGEFKVL